MKRTIQPFGAIKTAWIGVLIIVSLTMVSVSVGSPHPGKKIAFDRSKGNCLACHVIEDGQLPGNAGPPLVMMKQRFPNRKALRSQIWDPTEKKPISIMPPFGRHRILTDTEIDLIVDYLYTL